MLDIIMVSIIAMLLINLVVVFIVLGRGSQGSSWLLAILLTGTTGAALAAVMAGLSGAESSRFIDLSLILIGLAALPVVIRVVLLYRTRNASEGQS